MAKEKISQWDSNPANNTDVGGVNIAENCPPSNINNAIRQDMSQVKDMQAGTPTQSLVVNGELISNGNFSSNGSMKVTGTVYLDGSLGSNGQVMTSVGSANTPVWSTLGTMSSQNSNNVNITGGVVSGGTFQGTSKTGQGIKFNDMGTNAVGKKTVSSLSPSGGANGDVWYKV